MVEAFLSGITESFLRHILSSLEDVLDDESLIRVMQELISYSEREYFGPVVKMLQYLPKVELAEMAESLVNLTALRRKVSNEAETVGGPIDVAIVSKADGFKWVKKKSIRRSSVRGFHNDLR